MRSLLLLSRGGETAEDLLGVNIKKHIRPQFMALQEEIEKNAREKWNESSELLKENIVLEDALKEKQAFNSQMEARAKELEAICKKIKETLESFQSEVKKIQTQMEQDEETLKTLEHQSAETNLRTQKECEQQKYMIRQELQQESAKLFTLMEAVTGLMEKIDTRGNVLKASVADLKEMVRNNYIRKLKQSACGKYALDVLMPAIDQLIICSLGEAVALYRNNVRWGFAHCYPL